MGGPIEKSQEKNQLNWLAESFRNLGTKRALRKMFIQLNTSNIWFTFKKSLEKRGIIEKKSQSALTG